MNDIKEVACNPDEPDVDVLVDEISDEKLEAAAIGPKLMATFITGSGGDPCCMTKASDD